MTPEAYTKASLKYALYPFAGTKGVEELTHIALGLAGEAGEFAAKADAIVKKAKLGDFQTMEEHDALILELGDTLWYLERATWALGLDFGTILWWGQPDNHKGTPLVSAWTLDHRAMEDEDKGPSIWAGLFCEHVKKAASQDDGVLTATRRMALRGALINLAFSIQRLCVGYDITIGEVMQRNHDKLAARYERGNIHKGDGDGR